MEIDGDSNDTWSHQGESIVSITLGGSFPSLGYGRK